LSSSILVLYQKYGIKSLDGLVGAEFVSQFNIWAGSFSGFFQPAIKRAIIFEGTWHGRNLTKFPWHQCPYDCEVVTDKITCPFVVPGSVKSEQDWNNLLASLKDVQVSIIQAGVPCNLQEHRDDGLELQMCVDDSKRCYEVLYDELVKQYQTVEKITRLVQNLHYMQGKAN
jgi:hypothetical protein